MILKYNVLSIDCMYTNERARTVGLLRHGSRDSTVRVHCVEPATRLQTRKHLNNRARWLPLTALLIGWYYRDQVLSTLLSYHENTHEAHETSTTYKKIRRAYCLLNDNKIFLKYEYSNAKLFILCQFLHTSGQFADALNKISLFKFFFLFFITNIYNYIFDFLLAEVK